MAASIIKLRPPSSSASSQAHPFTPPSLEFLQGAWYVTHSTFPMWKTSRNVVITYKALESPAGSIEDLVQYQPLNSNKQKTVRGIDTPHPTVLAAYDWRGKGWLKIASTHWEVLGYGEEDGGWAVTFFQKTLFTPVGIDIYARVKGGLSAETVKSVREAISSVEHPKVKALAGSMFEVKHNW